MALIEIKEITQIRLLINSRNESLGCVIIYFSIPAYHAKFIDLWHETYTLTCHIKRDERIEIHYGNDLGYKAIIRLGMNKKLIHDFWLPIIS